MATIYFNMFALLDLCVSSLRRGHANLLCIVPILTDDPRRESNKYISTLPYDPRRESIEYGNYVL